MAPPPWATEEQRGFLATKISIFHELSLEAKGTKTRGKKNFKRISFLKELYKEFEAQFTKATLDSMRLPKLELGGTDVQRVEAWTLVSTIHVTISGKCSH